MNDRVLVAQMIAHIEKNLVEPISAEDLATISGYSLNRFRQKFFNVTGNTPSGYLRKRRLTEAAKEILAGDRIVGATLMSALKGASDYFDNDLSAAMLFGLSGHAFLINIHRNLEPSGPYRWMKTRFYELLTGLGIERVGEYELNKDGSETERRRVETELKELLQDGGLVTLDFLEHQLVAGFDEHGFLMLQPWGGKAPSEVKSLTFGSWQECFNREGWAHFTLLRPSSSRKPLLEAADEALTFAEELYHTPERHEIDGFRIGLRAYDAWIDAVKRGYGTGHGNWWNAQVWAEARRFAADFISELSEIVPGSESICADLTSTYRNIAGMLTRIGARGDAGSDEAALDDQAKIALLSDAQQNEEHAAGSIHQLRSTVLHAAITA